MCFFVDLEREAPAVAWLRFTTFFWWSTGMLYKVWPRLFVR